MCSSSAQSETWNLLTMRAGEDRQAACYEVALRMAQINTVLMRNCFWDALTILFMTNTGR